MPRLQEMEDVPIREFDVHVIDLTLEVEGFALETQEPPHAFALYIDLDEKLIFYFNSVGTPTIRVDLFNFIRKVTSYFLYLFTTFFLVITKLISLKSTHFIAIFTPFFYLYLYQVIQFGQRSCVSKIPN